MEWFALGQDIDGGLAAMGVSGFVPRLLLVGNTALLSH